MPPMATGNTLPGTMPHTGQHLAAPADTDVGVRASVQAVDERRPRREPRDGPACRVLSIHDRWRQASTAAEAPHTLSEDIA